MLATLTEDYFSSEDWIYERKLDGERVLAFSRNGKVSLYSRNRKKINTTYPDLVTLLEDQEEQNYIVDGEVVAFEGNQTSFARLQNRMKLKSARKARKSSIKVYYYIFDMLHVDGRDISKVGLTDRKAILKKALSFDGALRFTPHRNKEGKKYHREACKKGWEGIIAKKADSTYVHSRSRDWLKFKCVAEQELVIGGFTEPRGSRIGFGALLVGYYERGKLRYAGKVGTGFDDDMLERLRGKMNKLEQDESPFEEEIREKSAHFIKPGLVGQFGFTEWTSDGKLRHPRFLGLRRDKDPEKVHRERPA